MNESDLGSLFGCFFLLVIVLGTVAIWWKVIDKTGFPPVLSLLMFVPLANLGLILYLAFAEWPIQRRVRELEEEVIQAQFQ